MWHTGIIYGASYEAKVFDEGSHFGINGGRISKLHVIKDGTCIINYDRGWDIKPTTPEALTILGAIIIKYSEV